MAEHNDGYKEPAVLCATCCNYTGKLEVWLITRSADALRLEPCTSTLIQSAGACHGIYQSFYTYDTVCVHYSHSILILLSQPSTLITFPSSAEEAPNSSALPASIVWIWTRSHSVSEWSLTSPTASSARSVSQSALLASRLHQCYAALSNSAFASPVPRAFLATTTMSPPVFAPCTVGTVLPSVDAAHLPLPPSSSRSWFSKDWGRPAALLGTRPTLRPWSVRRRSRNCSRRRTELLGCSVGSKISPMYMS